jgi:hypothetical protein
MANKYRAWVDGEVLTSANLIDYIQKNVVIPCDSSADYPDSSTRREGMTVYDKNADKLLTYTTSTTGWVAPWNMAWGVVPATSGGTSGYGYVKLTSSPQSGIGSSATDITNATVTFTAVANRLYRISAQADLIGTSLSVGQLQALVDGTASASALQPVTGSSGAWQDRSPAIVYATTLSAGSHTIKLAASVQSGSLTVNHSTATPTTLIIEDAGPVGAPA